MLTFFRRIRKGLLKEKRISKYLLYAFGEIVLVVLGILIALQVSDWNEERKFNQGNREYLNKILVELNMNMDRLEYLKLTPLEKIRESAFEPLSVRADTAMALLHAGLDTASAAWMLQAPWLNSSLFNLHHAVYDELTHNGRLNSLGTDTLEAAIERYYRRLAREQVYISMRNDRVLKRWQECKYGYGDLEIDYSNKGIDAFRNHSWIFQPTSKNYIDLKAAMRITQKMTHRNLLRLEEQSAMAQELKSIIQRSLDETER